MPLGDVLQALIMLAVVLLGSVFVGNLFRRFNQPAVVGVIFFNILLGTILAVSPHSINSLLLSATSKSLIDDVGQAGTAGVRTRQGWAPRRIGSVPELRQPL